MDDVRAEHPRMAAVAREIIDVPLVPHVGETIEGEVWLDGRSFVNCRFVTPHFRTRTGHFGWRDNLIVPKGDLLASDFTFELPMAFGVNTREVLDDWARRNGIEVKRRRGG